MTGFIFACVGMVLIAGLLIAWPLLRKFTTLPLANRWLTILLTVFVISAISGGIYGTHTYQRGGWNADNAPATGQTENVQLAQAIKQLEAQANENKNDAQAWIKLGAALVMAHRADQSISAYQHAYDITGGKVVDAVTGLAEALLMTRTEAAFTRASGLLDEALRMQPANPKALWYGGMVALQLNNLVVARDRFRSMLALNPPDKLRTMLEREIQDLDQQLGGAASNAPATGAQGAHSITVNVKLDPKLKDQIKTPMTLFILARDPNQPGPPLAVQRHMSTEIPLKVELSKANAMLPTRTIDGVDTVEVVARLSASGTPMQQPGDYAGGMQYSFGKQGPHGEVNIEINQKIDSAAQKLNSAPLQTIAAASQAGRRITVSVKLDSKLKDQIKSPMTLYILARVPNQGGPPLAVQRHLSSELPFTTELTKANAMMPELSIETADQVEVVARLSASGTPIQQSGDYVGSVQYSFAKQGQQGAVNIAIDHQVP